MLINNAPDMSLNAIRGNKILTKISEFAALNSPVLAYTCLL